MSESNLRVKCPRCQEELILDLLVPPEAYKEPGKPRSPQDVSAALPEALQKLVTVSAKDDDTITVKPNRYLGTEKFGILAQAIRDLGGEYVSAGKDSHFQVPRHP